jgi:hypothetical protein
MSIPTRTPSNSVCPTLAYTRQQLMNMRSNAASDVSNEVVRRLDFDNIINRSSQADIINPADGDVVER